MKCPKLLADPRVVQENDHGESHVEGRESAKLERGGGIESMEDADTEQPVHPAEACFAGGLENHLPMPVHNCTVSEPWWCSREGGLNNDCYKIDPTHTPHVWKEGVSSTPTDRQIERKEKRQWEMNQVRHSGHCVEERVR